MAELAFDREGNPFRFSHLTRKLRPRRWKNPGKRGTCAAVLDADGEQVLIDADAEYIEFRAAVGNVVGFYRLDQCDEDGTPIEDAPPAYVSIESSRNAAPAGEFDSRDAIIRDLAQINADMTRTMAERFSNVMQATAEILRAADGAGLPAASPRRHRLRPRRITTRTQTRRRTTTTRRASRRPPFGSLQPFVEMAMPHLPQFGAFLWMKFQEFMKQNATTPPAATSPAGARPRPRPAAAPSAARPRAMSPPGRARPHRRPVAAPAPVAAVHLDHHARPGAGDFEPHGADRAERAGRAGAGHAGARFAQRARCRAAAAGERWHQRHSTAPRRVAHRTPPRSPEARPGWHCAARRPAQRTTHPRADARAVGAPARHPGAAVARGGSYR